MPAIDRIFDIFRGVNPLRGRGFAGTVEADRARGGRICGRPFTQTLDEQAGTRSRMEAELDTQRERRVAAKE
jgi:hypothetical protein